MYIVSIFVGCTKKLCVVCSQKIGEDGFRRTLFEFLGNLKILNKF
jgi:hypothetical protein